jgi:uncharacterized radical SAM superfamily Fe-S cluster-containing enzyme
MDRKNRPWLFYDTTASVCAVCLKRVEAKILIKDEAVFLEKWCPSHGFERVLICDEADYYRTCREVYLKPPELPMKEKPMWCNFPVASRLYTLIFLPFSKPLKPDPFGI